MSNKTFFKIFALIILSGIVFYLVVPKYYVARGLKVNKVTGEGFRMKESYGEYYWKRVHTVKEKNNPYADLGAVPIPEGYVLIDDKGNPLKDDK